MLTVLTIFEKQCECIYWRRAQRRDKLHLNRNTNRQTVELLKKMVGVQALNSNLFQPVNSMERLIWRLTCGLDTPSLEKATGLYLASLRKTFQTPSANFEEIDSILQNTQIEFNDVLKATKVDGANFYVFPESQPHSDFVSLRMGVHMKDCTIKSAIIIHQSKGTFEREFWEFFWQVYNLVQEV